MKVPETLAAKLRKARIDEFGEPVDYPSLDEAMEIGSRVTLAWVREHIPTRVPCNCGAVDIGVGIMHEPQCGEPTAEDIADAVLTALGGKR